MPSIPLSLTSFHAHDQCGVGRVVSPTDAPRVLRLASRSAVRQRGATWRSWPLATVRFWRAFRWNPEPVYVAQ